MEKKITLDEIKKLAENATKPIKPMPVIIPDSAKKYDRIHISQERTKKILELQS